MWRNYVLHIGNKVHVMNYSLKALQVFDPQYVEEFYSDFIYSEV
jgi:hypothetical protein